MFNISTHHTPWEGKMHRSPIPNTDPIIPPPPPPPPPPQQLGHAQDQRAGEAHAPAAGARLHHRLPQGADAPLHGPGEDAGGWVVVVGGGCNPLFWWLQLEGEDAGGWGWHLHAWSRRVYACSLPCLCAARMAMAVCLPALSPPPTTTNHHHHHNHNLPPPQKTKTLQECLHHHRPQNP